MDSIFISLNNLISQGMLFTFLAAFVWGVLSIALSPCHLTSIPLIIGFIDAVDESNIKRRFLLSVLFASGVLVSIGIIGIITASIGRIAGDLGAWGNWFAAGIFIIIGLNFLNIIPLNFSGISSIPIKMKGPFAAILIGLFFGVALGPCTFAFMAPVLAVTFAKEGTNLITNFLVIFMYGLGHSFLIVLAGTFTDNLKRYLSINDNSNYTAILKKISGILLLIGAVYFIIK